jgi:hypothetical protein
MILIVAILVAAAVSRKPQRTFARGRRDRSLAVRRRPWAPTKLDDAGRLAETAPAAFA